MAANLSLFSQASKDSSLTDYVSVSQPSLLAQDVTGLANNILQVLLDDSVSASLAAAGRQTALAFTPSAIADR
jgi:hypothetical protein